MYNRAPCNHSRNTRGGSGFTEALFTRKEANGLVHYLQQGGVAVSDKVVFFQRDSLCKKIVFKTLCD